MPDEKLKERVEDYVGEVWEDVIADIRSLVRIRSVEDLSHATQKDPLVLFGCLVLCYRHLERLLL